MSISFIYFDSMEPDLTAIFSIKSVAEITICIIVNCKYEKPMDPLAKCGQLASRVFGLARLTACSAREIVTESAV